MERNKPLILVVEDDRQIQKFICYALESEGYPYITAGTGQEAISRLMSEHAEIMLLDLGLPDYDGLSIIKKVRQWSDIPVLVVSARDQDREKVAALDSGADDYLTKPFSTTELLARIRVALRHLQKVGTGNIQAVLQVDGLQIDLERRLVHLNGEQIHVTPMEYSLLALLFRHMGKVLTTAFIIKEIWGPAYGTDTQALRALMAGLRRKIEKDHARPRYILTEVGVGYRLTDE